MESELYRKVYQIVMKIYSKTNLKRITFTDADIVLTYLWAVLHDRPTGLAVNKTGLFIIADDICRILQRCAEGCVPEVFNHYSNRQKLR